jgi:hypothetical protein
MTALLIGYAVAITIGFFASRTFSKTRAASFDYLVGASDQR